MKATYTTATGRLSFSVEAQSSKELFGEIASIQEVFDAESHCGMPDCDSGDVHFTIRNSKNGQGKDIQYFELRCMACGARFSFGQSTDMKNLFPKRRVDGKMLPNGGWSRYNHQAEEEEPAESQRGQRGGVPERHQQDGPAASLPEDDGLQTALDRVKAKPHSAPAIFQRLMETLMERHGMLGGDRYNVIADQFGRQYRDITRAPVEALQGVVRQLFGELRSLDEGKVKK